MVDHFPGERLPFRIHDSVREAVRRAAPTVEGGWSEADWNRAATRAATVLRDLHEAAKSRRDRQEVLDLIGVAVELACEQDVTFEPAPRGSYPDWLSQAIVTGPSIEGLHLRVPSTSRTPFGQGVLDYIGGKVSANPLPERLRLLRDVFESSHPLRLSAGRHLGYALRRECRWDAALAVFDELVAEAPTPVNLRQRPKVLSLARRFVDARSAAEGTPTAAFVTRVAEYAHGRPERYFAEIDTKLLRMADGGEREYLEEVGVHLVRRALFRAVDRTEVAAFQDQAEGLGDSSRVRDALTAAVLSRSLRPQENATALDRLQTLDRNDVSSRTVGYRFATAELADAVLAGDLGRVRRLGEAVAEVPVRNRTWIPVELFLDWAGVALPPSPTQWLEPYDEVVARWRGHLTSYLQRHRWAGSLD